MELTNKKARVEKDYTLKRAAAVAVLFVGALGARIFWINQVRMQWGDEPFYTWLSGSVLDGRSASVSATGMSPLFATLANTIAHSLQSLGIGGALPLGAILPYLLFGGLLVAPVYGIARRMGGEAIAAGAGLATVFYPAVMAGLPKTGAMIEPMYLLLVASAWYLLLVAVDEGSLWPAAAGGLFVGLAYLTRPAAFLYLGFALGLVLVATWLSRKHSFALRRAAANFGIALAMFALIAGPYLPVVFQVRV